MKLPLVDVFRVPYESWEYRDLDSDEALIETNRTGKPTFSVRTNLLAKISNHVGAARHMLQQDGDNALSAHVDSGLKSSPEFAEMIRAMPAEVPSSLRKYKHEYRSCDMESASADVNAFGRPLHEGQVLFHGGYLSRQPGEMFATDRPLSTSFCPQIALQNAKWRGKAFEEGEVHLLVLRIASSTVKGFVFPLTGELSHENEVLIAPNVGLQVVSKSLVRSDFELRKVDSQLREIKKMVAAYTIEVDVVGGP